MFQHCALSPYALACALLTNDHGTWPFMRVLEEWGAWMDLQIYERLPGEGASCVGDARRLRSLVQYDKP